MPGSSFWPKKTQTFQQFARHPSLRKLAVSRSQFTSILNRSADLECYYLEGELPYSKIPSIFDHTVRNSSTIESYYQQRLWLVMMRLEKPRYNRGVGWIREASPPSHPGQALTRLETHPTNTSIALLPGEVTVQKLTCHFTSLHSVAVGHAEGRPP
jgi:hypothetical protein